MQTKLIIKSFNDLAYELVAKRVRDQAAGGSRTTASTDAWTGAGEPGWGRIRVEDAALPGWPDAHWMGPLEAPGTTLARHPKPDVLESTLLNQQLARAVRPASPRSTRGHSCPWDSAGGPC